MTDWPVIGGPAHGQTHSGRDGVDYLQIESSAGRGHFYRLASFQDWSGVPFRAWIPSEIPIGEEVRFLLAAAMRPFPEHDTRGLPGFTIIRGPAA